MCSEQWASTKLYIIIITIQWQLYNTCMSLFLSTTHYFCAAPSGSPLNFMIESVTALAVMLSWQAPELIDQNGEITHYVITYKASGSSDQMEELVMSAPGNDLPADFTYNHMLQGLVQDTQYSVQVAAATTSGTGPSVSLSFNTSGWYSFTFHNLPLHACISNWKCSDLFPHVYI